MLLHKGLTRVHSQKKPRLRFGESFTLRHLIPRLSTTSLFSKVVQLHSCFNTFFNPSFHLIHTSKVRILSMLCSFEETSLIITVVLVHTLNQPV